MEKINAAVTLNSVSLVALILLTTERNAIGRVELESQLELLIAMNHHAPYSDETYLPDTSSDQLVKQAKKLGTIFSVENPMGEIITTNEQTAILLTYYRNNILHIYISSSLLASCFLNQQSMTCTALIEDLVKLFPLLKKEFFLIWDETQFIQHIQQNIKFFIERKMLIQQGDVLTRANESDEAYNQLFIHAQIARPTLLRYGIILTLLSAQAGHESISRQELEDRSQQLAQRIAALYSLNAPEAFDKNLFRNTVTVLREEKLIRVAQDNSFETSAEMIELQDLILNKVNVNSRHLMQKTANWANKHWEKH